MKTTSVNVRVSEDLKTSADELFKSLGLNMTTAVNMFLVQAVQTNSIPFEIKLREPSEETYKAIHDAINDIDMSGPYDNVEDLMEALDA